MTCYPNKERNNIGSTQLVDYNSSHFDLSSTYMYLEFVFENLSGNWRQLTLLTPESKSLNSQIFLITTFPKEEHRVA